MNREHRSVINELVLRVVVVTMLGNPGVLSASQRDAKIDRKVDSLLAIMTIEEKCGQLNQLTGQWDKEQRMVITDTLYDQISSGRVGSFLNVVGAANTRKLQEIAVGHSRLGIPLLFGYDVIHGFRTIFPIPLAEASTWNPRLIEQAVRVGAVEASAAGVNWTFAPMVDIARDPRWGRIAEGSGEDPFLGSAMAAARVRGFQGVDLTRADNILACAKHFAAYGGAEAGRDYNVVDISERTLREVYLPPFKAAVDAGAATLMSSFNEIGGIPSTANHWLLTDVLRGEWNFEGFVVSDWTAIEELQPHGVAGSRLQAGVLALRAGVDMDMKSEIFGHELTQAVKNRMISEDLVTEAARRILRMKFHLGLFENPYRNCDTTLEHTAQLTAAHIALARRVAQQAIVLLKNEKGVLPLRKDIQRLAVFGPLADDRVNPLGSWHARGKEENVVTVLEGIRKKISARTRLTYLKGCEILSDSGFNEQEIQHAAGKADVAVVVVGESSSMSGEAASRSVLDLPGKQQALVRTIVDTGIPVVMVMINGRPLTIPWEAGHVDAIVEAWQLGVESGNAVADMLFGDVNSGGKLPVSFPRSVGQIPVYYNHKNTGRPESENKYTSKYLDVPNTPLYPFGYGLSYTTFRYSDLQLSASKIGLHDSVRVSVTVTNSGNIIGDEVIQLYVQDKSGSVTRPVKELKDFRRLTLEPGKSTRVEFLLHTSQLAFYDLGMKYTVEPGIFRAFVGGNSADVLETRFEILGN
jgi:beta-glucosidase